MAKVIMAFRERYMEMKLFNVGDDYPEEDKQRVKYLTLQGFLEAPTAEKPPDTDKKSSKKGNAGNGDPNA